MIPTDRTKMEKENHDDRIPELNGLNYQEWKRDMRMVLIMGWSERGHPRGRNEETTLID